MIPPLLSRNALRQVVRGRNLSVAPAAAPRIAICGAGVSGLTLAGILSNNFGENGGSVTVFERAPADRDQGYGLDLDEHGQEAIVRAGVYDHYWEISHPHSDSWAFYPPKGRGERLEPWAVSFRPRLLMKLFPSKFAACPETNRGGLRDVLLAALAERGNSTVHFETPAWDIREVLASENESTSSSSPSSSSPVPSSAPLSASSSSSSSSSSSMPSPSSSLSRAEVFDREGRSLGEFDLVVDAMGLHSTLRHYRVEDQVGKHFSGEIFLHVVISHPEASCSPQLVERLGRYGTVSAMGRGFTLIMQKFGAGPTDKRTCLFYTLQRNSGDGGGGGGGEGGGGSGGDESSSGGSSSGSDSGGSGGGRSGGRSGGSSDSGSSGGSGGSDGGEAELLREMGVSSLPSSRESGILTDQGLEKVKEWIVNDMGEHFDEVWKGAVRSLERVTVRGNYMHGHNTKLRGGEDDKEDGNGILTLPLVCIGDSPRNCGLGGGGNLALQDAVEVAKVLLKDDAFDANTGVVNLKPLREAEKVVLERKVDFHDGRRKQRSFMQEAVHKKGRGAWEWEDFAAFLPKAVPFSLAKALLLKLGKVSFAWYKWEASRGQAGTCEGDAPLYTNVKAAIDEKTQHHKSK